MVDSYDRLKYMSKDKIDKDDILKNEYSFLYFTFISLLIFMFMFIFSLF